MKNLLLLFAIVSITNLSFGQGIGTIIIKIDAIENNSGDIKAGLYKNNEGFPDDASKAYKIASSKIVDGKSTLKIKDVPFGNYVLAVFHDENGNKQLDKNGKGVPLEALGISNNVKLKFGPPKYEAALFELNQPADTLQINLQRYRTK
jgi:uncharacterized protein (DUF2141 family)